MQDLLYALRVLAKRPGFTLAAAFTLALGIAANTTIFSLISAVLLRPLPYPHADRLVSLWTSYAASNGQPDIFSAPNYLDVAAQSRTFEAVGAYDTSSFTLAGEGQPEYIPGATMSASMARVLGIDPQLGRWFTQQEDDLSTQVVLLSDSIWRTRFGADRSVVGRPIVLNARTFTIIGILPPRSGFPSMLTQIYTPVSFTPGARRERGNVSLNVAARLREGVPLENANAELRTIAARLAASYPDVNRNISMGAVPLQASIVGNVKPILLVLWTAVGFMLAVGCANVANLLLTHAAGRQREFALRRSLGASNGRLIRQLLTESVTLAGFGGILGLALAAWAIPAIIRRLPQNFPNLREIAVDPQVLWFTLGVSFATGILFGLAPAIGSTRRNLAESLRESDRGGRSASSRRVGRYLVVAEVAAVLVLLVGAGLVLRSLAQLSHTDPGFRTKNEIAWQLFLPTARYQGAPAQRTFYKTVLDQVGAMPGVEAVGLAQPLPFGPIDIVADTSFDIAGRPPAPPEQRPQALITRASEGYFNAMGIPIRRGRVFTAQDGETSSSVVISETLARRYFPNEDPIGRGLLLGRARFELQIIGVVGDVKHITLQSNTRPEFYLPMSRFTIGAAGLVVRTSAPAASMITPLQQRVWSIDNALAANLAAPVDGLLYASLAPARLTAILLAVFAGATLVLGLVGVYGVLSYSVRQGTREIGIRLALGATRRDVLRIVLGEALGLTGAGVLIGLAAAALLTVYMKSLRYRVPLFDPATYAAVAIAVTLAALLAAYPPARRATRIDPATSLRAE